MERNITGNCTARIDNGTLEYEVVINISALVVKSKTKMSFSNIGGIIGILTLLRILFTND